MGLIYFLLPVRLPSEIENFPRTHQREGFLVIGNFLWVSVPRSFVSLFNSLIFLSYLPSKTMGCFSGCLMSSVSDQKLFCGVFSVFK